MEPQDCFSIPYVIMLNNDIIVLLLVINPSLLTCYLSQGSVSVILTLVYPCCGKWHNEGQKCICISYLLYLCVIGLPCIMPWMNTCMSTCIIINQIAWGHAFHGGSVWHIGNSGFSQVFQVNWCHLGIRSIWPTLYFILTRPYHKLEPSYGTSVCRVYPWISR